MVSFFVRMKFSPEDRADITETLRLLADASETVVIYEQWKDKDALEAHGQSAHFKKHAVGGLYQKMRERAREDLVAVV